MSVCVAAVARACVHCVASLARHRADYPEFDQVSRLIESVTTAVEADKRGEIRDRGNRRHNARKTKSHRRRSKSPSNLNCIHGHNRARADEIDKRNTSESLDDKTVCEGQLD